MLFRTEYQVTHAEEKIETDLTYLDWLLEELRAAYRAARDSTDIQFRLRACLESVAVHSGERGDLTRREKLLREALMVGWPRTSLRHDHLAEVGKPVDLTARVYAWRMGKSLSLQLEPPPTYTWRIDQGRGGTISVEGNRAMFRATEKGRYVVWVAATTGAERDMNMWIVNVVFPGTAGAPQDGGEDHLTHAIAPNPYAGVYAGTVPVDVLRVDGKKGDNQAEAALDVQVSGEGWVRGTLEHLGNPEFTMFSVFNGQVSGDGRVTAHGMACGIARSKEREQHQWEEVSVGGEIGRGIFHGTISLVPGPIIATRQ